MALDSGIFVKIDHFLKSLIFNQKSVIFCYYQTCFIFKKWMRFYSKITLFFKKEWENTLKWKNSKVPPLQWHFWTIFERVLTRAKIVFHTFLTPQTKNFENFVKNWTFFKNWERELTGSNFSKIDQNFKRNSLLSNSVLNFHKIKQFLKNFLKIWKLFF